mgnify:FL=1
MTRIRLIGSTDDFEQLLDSAYTGGAPVDLENVEVTGFDPMTVERVLADHPDVVGVGPGLGEDDALKFVEELTRQAPQLGTIMVINTTTELWPRALRAGVRDMVTPITGPSALRETFDRVTELGRRVIETMDTPAATAAPSARVIAVISPKGGSGKTTVASNLAVTVARQHPDDVVITDLDTQFGDLVHAFRLEPEYSMLHAVAPGVTPTMLKGFLTPHPSDVLTLTAPDRPEDADDISPEAAVDVVRDLASMFGCVVVDTAAGLDERTLAVLEVATDVVFVSATDVPSVRAVVKELDILRRLGALDGTRTHLVLNRSDARVGLSPSDIQETIGLDAALELPSSRAIPAALNLGEPVVATDSRGSVARSFDKFAAHLGLVEPPSEANWPWRKR